MSRNRIRIAVSLVLVMVLTLCSVSSYAVKARFYLKDGNQSYHSSHLRLHIGSRNCKTSGDYIKIRTKAGGNKVIGHLEIADIFSLDEIDDHWAKITVLYSAKTSPDSKIGMTGWVDADYIECPCSSEEYYANNPRLTYSLAKANQDKTIVREETAKGSRAFAKLQAGEQVEVISEYTGSDQKLWYRVRCNNSVMGYIRSDRVTITQTGISEFTGYTPAAPEPAVPETTTTQVQQPGQTEYSEPAQQPYQAESSIPGLQICYSDPENIVQDQESGIKYVNNELLLMKTKNAPDEEVRRLIAEMNGQIIGWNEYLREYQVQFNREYTSLANMQGLIDTFERSGLFQGIYPNYYTEYEEEGYDVNDAEWRVWLATSDKHWGVDAIHGREMWAIMDNTPTVRVNVGLIDSLFYTQHPDLSFVDTYENDYERYKYDVELGAGWLHGTHVAGILAANHNDIGIAGVAKDINLYGFSFYGRYKMPEDETKDIHGNTIGIFQAGLTYLLCAKECKVVNISMGFGNDMYDIPGEDNLSPKYYTHLNEKIRREGKPLYDALRLFLDEYKLDFVIACAAGNQNLETNKPRMAMYTSFFTFCEDQYLKDRIIVVGNAAIDGNGNYFIMDDCCPGQFDVDLLAPGTGIWSTVPPRDGKLYDYDSGTSMATPQVAGVAANMWSVNPNLTGPQIKRIIISNQTGDYTYRADLSAEFRVNTHHGMLDGLASVMYAKANGRIDQLNNEPEVTATPEPVVITTPAPASSVSERRIVTFGRFEQDNNPDNGPEPIEWVVLEVRDGKALLHSKYILYKITFDMRGNPWENSSIRTWLNSEFLNMAFNTEEQSVILITDVDNSAAQGEDYVTQGFPNTQDRVFLLSYKECCKYYPGDEEKLHSPTAYAIANGAHIYKGNGEWWLRTPYEDEVDRVILRGWVAGVPCHTEYPGVITYFNCSLRGPGICPAIWVDLNSGILN